MNKYRIALVLCGSLALSAHALAQQDVAQTIQQAEQQTVHVADIKHLANADAVQLTGTLVKHLNLDNYEFNDGTGLILLDINEKTWKAAGIHAGDQVHIDAEVAKHSYKPTGLHVTKIEKVN